MTINYALFMCKKKTCWCVQAHTSVVTYAPSKIIIEETPNAHGRRSIFRIGRGGGQE